MRRERREYGGRPSGRAFPSMKIDLPVSAIVNESLGKISQPRLKNELLTHRVSRASSGYDAGYTQECKNFSLGPFFDRGRDSCKGREHLKSCLGGDAHDRNFSQAKETI